jgi:predicted transcriptional regulator
VTLRRKSDLVQFRSMTKMMKEAIAVLHELPEERQETIARAIIDYASHDEGVYHLTDDERAEVRAGLAEIERGEIAPDDEVRAVYKRIGV